MLFPLHIVNLISKAVVNEISWNQDELYMAKWLKRTSGETLDTWLKNNTYTNAQVRGTHVYQSYSRNCKRVIKIKQYLRTLHSINIYIRKMTSHARALSGYAPLKDCSVSLFFSELELKLILGLFKWQHGEHTYGHLAMLKRDWSYAKSEYLPDEQTLINQVKFLEWKIARKKHNKVLNDIKKAESVTRYIKSALKELNPAKPKTRVYTLKAKLNKLYWNIKRGTY